MLLPGYDVGKAAQAVAFLAMRSGGSINVLKLSKLLYLAEREFMAQHDTPMFFDKLVSMPDGPVASITLNLINGNTDDDVWSRFVSPRDGYDVHVQEGIAETDLDSLSRADKHILNELWERFGGYDKYELRDWTHQKQNIPEWEDPQGSSRPIHHEDVFRRLNKDDSVGLASEIHEYRRIRELFSACE